MIIGRRNYSQRTVQSNEAIRVVVDASDCAASVHPMSVEAHALPFAEQSFDAIVSFDAYHYFGTDDLYLGYISRFLKPGGRLGIVNPGTLTELPQVPPPALAAFWEWDFCSFHSPEWWRRHWHKTGLMEVETADALMEGWKRLDAGRTFGFVRLIAKRPMR